MAYVGCDRGHRKSPKDVGSLGLSVGHIQARSQALIQEDHVETAIWSVQQCSMPGRQDHCLIVRVLNLPGYIDREVAAHHMPVSMLGLWVLPDQLSVGALWEPCRVLAAHVHGLAAEAVQPVGNMRSLVLALDRFMVEDLILIVWRKPGTGDENPVSLVREPPGPRSTPVSFCRWVLQERLVQLDPTFCVTFLLAFVPAVRSPVGSSAHVKVSERSPGCVARRIIPLLVLRCRSMVHTLHVLNCPPRYTSFQQKRGVKLPAGLHASGNRPLCLTTRASAPCGYSPSESADNAALYKHLCDWLDTAVRAPALV